VLYCLFVAGLVIVMVRHLRKLTTALRRADVDGDGEVTISEFTAMYGKDVLEERSWTKTILSGNLGMTLGDIHLMMRRLTEMHELGPGFDMAKYVESVAADCLNEMATISPLTWLLQIPPIAVLMLVKIQCDAPGDDDLAKCAGEYSSVHFLLTAASFEVVGLVFTSYSYMKTATLKRMLRPRVRESACGAGLVQLHAPPLEDEGVIERYAAGWLTKITNLATRITGSHAPAHSKHHELFGIAGHKGLKLLLQLIKLNCWYLVVGPVIGCLPIVKTDLTYLSLHGASPAILTELTIFGVMAGSFICMAILIMPEVFELYIVVTTSCEPFKQHYLAHMGEEAAHLHEDSAAPMATRGVSAELPDDEE